MILKALVRQCLRVPYHLLLLQVLLVSRISPKQPETCLVPSLLNDQNHTSISHKMHLFIVSKVKSGARLYVFIQRQSVTTNINIQQARSRGRYIDTLGLVVFRSFKLNKSSTNGYKKVSKSPANLMVQNFLVNTMRQKNSFRPSGVFFLIQQNFQGF